MPVYDELDRKSQKSALIWLTIVWLAALAFFLTTYFQKDLEGSRIPALWDFLLQAYLCLLIGAFAVFRLMKNCENRRPVERA